MEDWVTRFTVGEDYRWDTLLLPYDVEGTRVQAWSLNHIGILSDEEFTQVGRILDEMLLEIEKGTIVVTPEEEDCHTVIEEYLTERLGDTGKKIHTGRSRNDQVLVALRLFLRDQLRITGSRVIELVLELCNIGEHQDDTLMPGYTHLQRAMPTTPGLWAMGFAELLTSDLDVLQTAFDQVNVSPLGSAAGYGVPHLDLPRNEAARKLGFRDIQKHVTSVQLSRGKLELMVAHALLQVAATINRLASDLVLFNTSEFGFVELPAAYCTGSSIMPQKQNPDVLELARATFHRIAAETHVLITLPANLPSGYHRDLQLTKEAVMRSTLLVHDLLTAMIHVIPGIRFNRKRLVEACTPDLFATSEALERVRAGMPFRDAYRVAAAHLEQIQTPDTETALAAYLVAGYPGKCVPDEIRRAAELHREWISDQRAE